MLYAEGLKNFEAFIRDLRMGGMRKMGAITVHVLALKIANLIKARYREVARQSGTNQPWAERATRVGKEKGSDRPARLPQPEGWGYIDQLAMMVETVRLANGRWKVQVAPNQTFAYHTERGPISHLMADWIENPKPMVIEDTHRAMVYRIMMQEGRGGYGTRKRPPNQPNLPRAAGYVHIPTERPVWQKVAADLMKPQVSIMYTRDLMVRMRRFAKNYGAL
jgi:hypothetical protein